MADLSSGLSHHYPAAWLNISICCIQANLLSHYLELNPVMLFMNLLLLLLNDWLLLLLP
jgi:hypothetical protein